MPLLAVNDLGLTFVSKTILYGEKMRFAHFDILYREELLTQRFPLNNSTGTSFPSVGISLSYTIKGARIFIVAYYLILL